MNDFIVWLAEIVGEVFREALLVLGIIAAALIVLVVLAVYWPGAVPPRRPAARPDLSRVPVAHAVPEAFNEVLRDLQPETAKTGAPRGNLVTFRPRAFARSGERPGVGRRGTPDAGAARIALAKRRLLAWATRSQRITFLRICPPGAPTIIGDYDMETRVVRACPNLHGADELEVLTHEVAHHLQGLRGRLSRSPNLKEDEADAVAVVALRVVGFDIDARDQYYLSEARDHVTGLRASRRVIEAMAETLARVMRGEHVTP